MLSVELVGGTAPVGPEMLYIFLLKVILSGHKFPFKLSNTNIATIINIIAGSLESQLIGLFAVRQFFRDWWQGASSEYISQLD